MGSWDAVFDGTYLQTYLPMLDDERTRVEALGAVALAEVEPGGEILDCPVGVARHAILLTEEGYRVTGLDRSSTQLAEAERRRGDAEWPTLVHGDYRQLPFADDSFDAVLTLFSSLGYLERDEDCGVLRELRRVLRPGGALIVETAHHDALARFARPRGWRTWDRLPDGSLFLQEQEVDWAAGTTSNLHLIVAADGRRTERRYILHVYSVKEWTEMLCASGFASVETFAGWDDPSPATPESWRLIIRAR